jgi:hypothetical protein
MFCLFGFLFFCEEADYRKKSEFFAPVDVYILDFWGTNARGLMAGRAHVHCVKIITAQCSNTRYNYKVVQIWPGLFVCKQVIVCPGHIWNTLNMYLKNINTGRDLNKEISTNILKQ